jgi:hypothetical protein
MKTGLLFLVILLSGCFSATENNEALLKKKGIQNIKVGDVDLTTRLLNNSDTANANTEKPLVYFNIRINQMSDKKFDKDKILYADFDIQKDFVLATGKDSLAASFCQKIENGRSHSYEYIVAFEIQKEKMNSGLTLVYNDKIFSVGTVAFVYQPSDLKNYEPKS